MISCYLDTRGNSRANTCDNTRLLEGWYLLDKKPSRFGDVPVIHNNFSKCMALRRRWFIQISALSTFFDRGIFDGFAGEFALKGNTSAIERRTRVFGCLGTSSYISV